MKEEIHLSLGELEAIKRRMKAALQLAEHPECDLTIYFFELAAVQLLSLLEQNQRSLPDKELGSTETDSQPGYWISKLKH